MELIFVFAIIFVKILLSNFLQVMKIVGTFRIHTFMNAKEFTVYLGNECIAAMRTDKPERSDDFFSGRECLSTDFALILTVTAIVIVEVMMRSSAKRANSIFWDGLTITTLNRFNRLSILPLIVFEKELPILFDEGFDDRKLVNLEFLILRGVGIIESPLFQWYISADKVNKPADLLMLVLNILK